MAEAKKVAKAVAAPTEAKAVSKKLAAFVQVDGVVYGPDDSVPADVAKKITNPKAWA